MNTQVCMYDAFTGMSMLERTALERFLREHAPGADSTGVKEAIDYALKTKPSFGGFVLVHWEDKAPIAAVVINKTGMDGFSSTNLMVYATLHKKHYRRTTVLKELMQQAVKHAKGEIAMHVERGSSAMKLFKTLGFEEKYIELRLGVK